MNAPWLSRGRILYLAAGGLLLLWMALAELRGWGGGTSQKTLPRQQLRQTDLGYRNHLFWYHGYRGK